MGYQTAVCMANFSTLVEVAAMALGGKDNAKSKNHEDLSQASPEAFAARVAAMTSL